MIVQMKKVTFLFKSSWADAILETLGREGVVHLCSDDRTVDGQNNGLKDKLLLANKALSLVPEKFREEETPSGSKENGLTLAQQVIDAAEEESRLKEEITRLEKELNQAGVWGGFNPADITVLKEKGFNIKLFQCLEKDLDNIPESLIFHIISRRGKTIFFVAVFTEETFDIPFTEMEIPARDFIEIKRLLKEKNEQLSHLRQNQSRLFAQSSPIQNTKKMLEDFIYREKAREQIGRDDDISYLTGFCPESDLENLLRIAGKKQWAVLVEEPSDEDPVPTLIRYSKFSRIFQPVMNFIGLKPGYREYDVNIFFLVFLSIFFAMLIGDGGYGLIIFAAAFLLNKYYKAVSKETTLLLYIMSSASIFWGAVTGQWFGVEAISQMPLFRKMIIPPLYSYAGENDANIIRLCFLVGATQLSLARLWAAFRKYPSLPAFAEIGWIAIIWSIYFIACFLVLNDNMPLVGFVSLFTGIIMIALFGEQKKDGIAKGILTGLVKFPFNALQYISSFSDLVSYVRLFAVGIATREVAVAFNSMALDLGFDSFATLTGAVLILIFGHSVNLLLGAMAILVHGIRLNILECANHLNVQWSGIPYKPFRVRSK